jgi:hypothetical protein
LIEPAVLGRLRKGVCAVGYLPTPPSVYEWNSGIAGLFTVVGTGFLVREGVVMTNRHVIDDLNRAVEPKKLPESEMFLLFIVFRAIGKLQQLAITPRKIRATYTVRDGRSISDSFASMWFTPNIFTMSNRWSLTILLLFGCPRRSRSSVIRTATPCSKRTDE